MKNFKPKPSPYCQNLEDKKIWYSPTADAYNKFRPSYPQKIINRVVELAQLEPTDSILEIGCGPGKATVDFAKLGYAMVCLEPNRDFCQLAKQNCSPYSKVEIQNTSFEEWELEGGKFDAVLAASSLHWVSQDIVYPKAASALKDDGYIILLWNVVPEPNPEIYQVCQEVYQAYAPAIGEYESPQAQQESLSILGESSIKSGKFKNLVFGQMVSEATYTIEDYLALLSTLSPYLKLESQGRDLLFSGMREQMAKHWRAGVGVSFRAAFHLAQKC